jgi:hypothetical protein
MKKLILIMLMVGFNCIAQKSKSVVYSYENTSTLLQFLNDSKVNYDVKDLAVLNHINNWIGYKNKNIIVIPNVFFFNKRGERITEDFNAMSCGQVIKDIDKISSLKTDPNDNISTWLEGLSFPFTNEEVFPEPYDLYVVIFYAKMVKTKTSNPTAFNWYNSLKENKSLKIKPILLSLDIMDNWEMSDSQKKALNLK